MSSLVPQSSLSMFQNAQAQIDRGKDPQVLLTVAIAWRDHWAELAERFEAGEALDGRASIYTGETYAQARDRWEDYRVLLLEDMRAPDGGLH